MKNLFVVDGASGTGKSDLLRWVSENNAFDVGYIRKGTTREKRDYERNEAAFLLDLNFVSAEEFERCGFTYAYAYGGNRYGFSVADINGLALRLDNVFVIVRNLSVIRRLREDFAFMDVVSVFIYTDRDALERRLYSEGLTAEVVTFRLERSVGALKDYYAHPDAYDETIINNSSRDVFHNTVERLLAKYNRAPPIDPYLVTVMMSFNPNNPSLEDYYDAMKRAVATMSDRHRCERVDRAPGSPKIAEQFRTLIQISRCVVVDITENRQNVYYELGYAQASGKTCLITAVKGTEPMFYPREHSIIFYENARDLEAKLAQHLRRVLRELG